MSYFELGKILLLLKVQLVLVSKLLEPWMLQGFACRESILWVVPDELADEVLRFMSKDLFLDKSRETRSWYVGKFKLHVRGLLFV